MKLSGYSLIALLLCSCAKNTNHDPISPSPNVTVSGIEKVYVPQNGTGHLRIEVGNKIGQEKISLGFKNLPAHVTADFSVTDGIPPYISYITFKAETGADSGIFPVTLYAATAASGTKDYNVDLQLSLENLCTYAMNGIYVETTRCLNGTGKHGVDTISAATDDRERIIITLEGAGKIEAWVDCSDNSISIPAQYNSYGHVAGNGIFDENTVNIAYTINGNQCEATLTR